MEIQDKVFDRVAESLGVDRDALKPETTFESLGADSLDMVEFSMEIEEEFGISIEQEDISKIKTLGDAVEFIKSKAK